MIAVPRLDRRFPKNHRITQRAQFQHVYRFGRRIETPYFVLYCLPNDTGRHRLGITASKKMGNAVLRNRLKRMFREMFRNCLFPEIPNLDIIVNTKRSATNCPYQVMEAEFRRIFQMIGSKNDG